jgi:hypothetical protein
MQKLTSTERVLKNTNSFLGRMNRLVIGARASAKAKNYVFDISRQDVIERWQRQGGLCAYTGWPMSTETKNSRLASIDRIDSSIGYTKDNIQLTCWSVNRAKSFMNEKEFIFMCKAIMKNKKNLLVK